LLLLVYCIICIFFYDSSLISKKCGKSVYKKLSLYAQYAICGGKKKEEEGERRKGKVGERWRAERGGGKEREKNTIKLGLV